MKTKTAANHCGRFCFFRREPSASGATGAILKVLRKEDGGWQLLAARGWRGFCFIFCKRHDSHEAGGDQQASTKWAAGGLQMAETNGAGMKRKDVERSEALECNAGAMSKAVCRTEQAAMRKKAERKRHDRLRNAVKHPKGNTAFALP